MKTDKSTFSTDKEIKALKAKDKQYILTDNYTKGLQLIVRTDNGKQWAFRYSSPTLMDKQSKPLRRQTGLGTYPLISLIEARNKANELRKEMSNGIDPLEHKKETKEQIITDDKSEFHKVVYQWLDEVIFPKSAKRTYERNKRVFERDVLPFFSKKDENGIIVSSCFIRDIHHSDIIKVAKEKSKTSKDTAQRIIRYCDSVWRLAISYGYCENNIIANISKEVLPSVISQHYAKVTDEKILSQMLKDIDSYKASPIVRNALRLVPYVMLRAENLTALKWEYIDFETKTLTIPRTLMKVKNKNLNDFKLPLTDKAIEILNDMKPLTEWTGWVFCGRDFKKPLNKESCNKALKTMGYNDDIKGTKQRIHSFRGTFRSLVETYANEHRASYEVKEAVLDHFIGNKVSKAYTHKADYTEQMRELLQWWEQYLERVKSNY